ncbi:MAG TPA: cytochrome b [Gammaproteobacteria bacterium]|nr:cytochrome b [Gammaproteobacteria bacterium]
MWRNSRQQYGIISITLHWLVALLVFSQFGLGLWMVELDYYDGWYQRAPDLHKSIGITLFGIMVLRLFWRYVNPRPAPLPSLASWEKRLSGWLHVFFYPLLFVLMLSGYLISTADGRAIAVFDLFRVPATLTSIPDQEDVAGLVHQWLAYTLIGLVALHALAALKHHFLDRDATLTRMLRGKS